MSRDDTNAFEIGHLAPGRRRVGPLMLYACFMAGPVLWSAQLVVDSSIAGIVCLDTEGAGTAQLATSADWAAWALAVFNVGALALTLLALVVSLYNVRRARAEATAEGEEDLRPGKGRVHFMAAWGFWSSVLFSVAIGFNTVAVFLDGMCPTWS